MQGVHTYEEQIKNPNLSIIDFEYIILHPEAKLAIQERYHTDVFFREKINEAMARDVIFKNKFLKHFKIANRSR